MTIRNTLPIGEMSRRQLLTVLVAAPLVTGLLAACGSDGSGESTGSPASDPATPTVLSPEITFSTGPDDVVVRIDQGVGGYTTPEWAYAQIPTLVVAGDGTTVSPGPQIEIYPPPMLPALQASTLNSVRIGELLAEADSLGLLSTPPDYESTQPPVADAGSTVVTFNVNGVSYVHSAPALGLEQDQADDARKRLAEFVTFATTFVGEAAASSAVYEPSAYVVGTIVVNVSDYTGDIAPTVVPWPESFGEVPLADGTCLTVDGETVRTELAAANQLTFFDASPGAAGVPTVVRLLLRPVLPGSAVC